MSKDEIGELEALLERATPGPWEGGHDGIAEMNNVSEFIKAGNGDWLIAYGQLSRDDRRLIVALRNHAPALIARLRTAEAERDAAIREMSSYARQAAEWQVRYEGSEAAGAVEGWRDRAHTAESRVAALEEGLRSVRGWFVTCSESATAKRDLKRIDTLLSETNHG